MMFLKAKITLIVGGIAFLAFLGLLAFVAIFISDEDGEFDTSMSIGFSDELNNRGLAEDVLAHQPMVERYASEYDISEHVPSLLAIIAVESGGSAEDVMQSSESLGLSPNSLGTEESIEQGTKYFAELLQAAEANEVDTRSEERKSTRLNSSHVAISYAVFCLITKKENKLVTRKHSRHW